MVTAQFSDVGRPRNGNAGDLNATAWVSFQQPLIVEPFQQSCEDARCESIPAPTQVDDVYDETRVRPFSLKSPSEVLSASMEPEYRPIDDDSFGAHIEAHRQCRGPVFAGE